MQTIFSVITWLPDGTEISETPNYMDAPGFLTYEDADNFAQKKKFKKYAIRKGIAYTLEEWNSRQ